VDVDLSFKESVVGADKELTLSKFDSCERCAGLGAEPGTKMKECADCGGKGVRVATQRTILGTFQTKTTCPTCRGDGEVPTERCSSCRGDGVVRAKKTLSVHIPAGVEDGNVLRVRQAGEAVKGGGHGDLFVRLHVKRDPRFERRGSLIYSTLKIGFTQAALGDRVEAETVEGKTTVEIPAGIQSRTEIRQGRHVFVVQVVTPTHLSREQKKQLEDLDLHV
jgi:molecular chaperone DnaJ